MKSIYELIDKSQETWNILQEWKRESTNKVEFLPANKNNAEKVLYDLQVTAKSILGAISYYTGGILVANGWVRILGSGADNFNRDISIWNKLKLDGALLVADDVIGGFFAINGGYFEGEVGNIFYLAPDTLEWEDLELKFSDFVYWTFTGDISKFYEIFRWAEWEKETSKVTGDMGILNYPFLWAESEEIEKRSRKVVPIEELWGITNENKKRLGL
ncbi:hypothetical protein CPAST_c07680 [Clostridium pasteurianum DSM 525 = ATCC 6013]|uniref:DUF2625 domain-containing protein n=1 Tax=Clostridium pasteurianum DSM 525 = ATCC 6013 TaxID=1262449 RepID=A0A0H3J4L0_CLOPA|nr:DUF2625 family protein [Clostridium pasteurianum]AJA46868.1 hypothetical protein CPAST_c07680 [Clostridium pasteurianum DSM 525 = ATCC 6013]AJA50856.1 hypothetical protein CLPA_c07680 [Clostridium pasteurianum DSM 525 = ATCC 6013]AOZ74254.1 hypothetical protein AQ983_03700 [Clostridium pasteurianum DSM 525 = ATCC 6013]AOZ78052.1 hypothetical protein AQ984_03700 [Clostridium pasteurianum]ELP58519.1 hypothetical protein F502_13595 [Clostridium pasteurianum DSM 525 = ATCC 6013]